MSSTPRIIEKTAANMSERMRERNLQLEKEKEGRRVVMVEDDSFLNGKNRKGKGKKGPMKGQFPGHTVFSVWVSWELIEW